MNWYYVEQGQQTGPANDDQMAGMLQTGKINTTTLVWHEGMAEWLPFDRVQSDLKPSASRLTEDRVPPVVAQATEATGQTAEAACAECGKLFPLDEMIRHGNVRICANCKPVFMQKLSEGAPVLAAGELNYASVLTRFAAVFLDGVILMMVNMLMGLIFGLSIAQAAGLQPRGVPIFQFLFFGLQMGIAISYEVILIGKYGATLGKMACKIKVVTADGGNISYMRALGRYFAKLLSSLTCLIGYIIAFFDKPQRRALHDHICNTRVVYK